MLAEERSQTSSTEKSCVDTTDVVHTAGGSQEVEQNQPPAKRKRTLSRKLSDHLSYFIDVIRLADHYERLDDVDECLLDYRKVIKDDVKEKAQKKDEATDGLPQPSTARDSQCDNLQQHRTMRTEEKPHTSSTENRCVADSSSVVQDGGQSQPPVKRKRTLSKKLSDHLSPFIDVTRLAEHYQHLDDVDVCLLDYKQAIKDGAKAKEDQKDETKDGLPPDEKVAPPPVAVTTGPKAEKVRPTETCYSWLVVVCGFLLHGISIGLINSFSPMLVFLMRSYGTTESVTSIIGAMQKAVFYLSGLMAAPLISKLGWRLTILLGSVFSAAGFVASAFAPSIYMLYVTLGILPGFGLGLLFFTPLMATQHYFAGRRATATGLLTSGAGIGMAATSLLTQLMIERMGFTYMLLAQASSLVLAALLGLAFRPLPKTKTIKAKPKDKSSVIRTLSATSEHMVVVDKPTRRIFNFSLFKKPSFILICAAVIFFCIGNTVPFIYLQERGIQLGLSPRMSSVFVSVIGGANILSRVLCGPIGDRSPTVRYILCISSIGLQASLSMMMPLFTSVASIVIYSGLFGIALGTFSTYFSLVLVDIFGVGAVERAIGQAWATAVVAYMVSPSLSGVIIEQTHNYDLPFQIMGAVQVLAIVALLVAKRPGRSSKSYWIDHTDVEAPPVTDTEAPPVELLSHIRFVPV